MRDDVGILSIEWDDGDSPPERALARELQETRQELDHVLRERDAHRLMRDSWAEQWERDQHLRARAEHRVQALEALLARARDLLDGWAASHPDRGLEPRTRRAIADLDEALRGEDVW